MAIGNYKPVTPTVVPPVVPKVETPKVDVPKVETPKVDVPKVEVPKVETPKVETPKTVDVPTGIAALDPHYVHTISGGLSGYMTYGNGGKFLGFIKDDQKGTNLDPYVAQQAGITALPSTQQQAAAQQQPLTLTAPASGPTYTLGGQGPTGPGITAPAVTAAQQAAAQQQPYTLTAPASGPVYTLGGQGPNSAGIAALPSTQQQQTVVETDAERIARQQASIAALEASYPQQFSLTATQPQQQPTYSGIAAPTAVTTNNQLTLAQPQQQYTLGPQVPQQTSLQAFGDRAREINAIQNKFTSAADASAYEAAHPGYANNVYTP